MADDQEALLARISALSGAIQKHRAAEAEASSPSYTRATPGYRGPRPSSRGRGALSHGPQSSRHRSIVFTGPSSEHPPLATGNDEGTATQPSEASTSENGQGWIKRKSTHNMSLVSSKTFEKT